VPEISARNQKNAQKEKKKMKQIKITERERDFLDSIIEYFGDHSASAEGYIVTRKGYKFRTEEINKLQEKLE